MYLRNVNFELIIVKRKILFIILIISLIINVVLFCLLMIGNSSETSNISDNKETEKDRLIGIYQATYYNHYDAQMLETLKISSEGVCTYEKVNINAAGKYEKACLWSLNNDTLIITIDSENKYAEVLSNGDLLINNLKFTKLK